MHYDLRFTSDAYLTLLPLHIHIASHLRISFSFRQPSARSKSSEPSLQMPDMALAGLMSCSISILSKVALTCATWA